MRFDRHVMRKRPPEAVVPMINVVFLLLIFFLMSAVIAAPPPIDVRLPGSDGAGAKGAPVALYVGKDGTLAYGDARGDAAVAAAARAGGGLDIRADANLPATTLAALLSRLAAAGVTDTRLMTVAP